MTTVEIIDTKADYKFALKNMEELIHNNITKAVPAYDELDMIEILESSYEDIHYPIAFTAIIKGKPGI